MNPSSGRPRDELPEGTRVCVVLEGLILGAGGGGGAGSAPGDGGDDSSSGFPEDELEFRGQHDRIATGDPGEQGDVVTGGMGGS